MGPSPLIRLDDAMQDVTLLGFDMPPIIYFVEAHPAYLLLVNELFRRVATGTLRGRSSVLTLTEVLTHPKRTQDRQLEQQYRQMLLQSHNFRLISTNRAIADHAADLRARYNLRTPDAIQLATALEAGCDAFLTNDLALRRVNDLRVLALSTLAL